MGLDKGEPSRPPPDLQERTIPLTKIGPPPDFPPHYWQRIAKTKRGPVHFSKDPGWRFSRADMPGTLYLAHNAATAFKEVFWDDLVSRPPKERRLDRAKVEERSLYEGFLPDTLSVIDTTKSDTLDALSAHGGAFGGPYAICQDWAYALRAHGCEADGILYESVRNKGNQCLALFEERCARLTWEFGSSTPLLEIPRLKGISPDADVVIAHVLSNGSWNPKTGGM